MINIKIKQSDGHINIDVSGHAEYAEKGKDIICAGVSALTQGLAHNLHRMSEEYPKYIKFEMKSK